MGVRPHACFPQASFVTCHAAFEAGLSPGESSAPSELWTPATCGEGNLIGSPWPEGPYDEHVGEEVVNERGGHQPTLESIPRRAVEVRQS